MNHAVRKFLPILLVFFVISLGGLAQVQAAEHAGHHAHHQAATHGTLLCSWMCAAGQGWETVVVPAPFELTPVERIEFAVIGQPTVAHGESPATRGPPLR